MKLCRFGKNQLGLVEDTGVRDVTEVLDSLPCCYRYPLPRHDILIANLDAVTAQIKKVAASAPLLPLDRLKLLSPIANPGKIVAAPVNYQKHLDEVKVDPNLHQALQQVPSPDKPPMTVLAEYERGYTLHDRVVRPSTVIVSAPTTDGMT